MHLNAKYFIALTLKRQQTLCQLCSCFFGAIILSFLYYIIVTCKTGKYYRAIKFFTSTFGIFFHSLCMFLDGYPNPCTNNLLAHSKLLQTPCLDARLTTTDLL